MSKYLLKKIKMQRKRINLVSINSITYPEKNLMKDSLLNVDFHQSIKKDNIKNKGLANQLNNQIQ